MVFTESERLEKIKQVQGRTYTNMCEVLERDGICNVDRPCGLVRHMCSVSGFLSRSTMFCTSGRPLISATT